MFLFPLSMQMFYVCVLGYLLVPLSCQYLSPNPALKFTLQDFPGTSKTQAPRLAACSIAWSAGAC